jgi:predicted regulator of Ras-like GTPase activity (Roadblock/LC7/MglB family)
MPALGRDPAGQFSIAQAAARLDGTQAVRQVTAETDGMPLVAMAAGITAVPAVLADQETDVGLPGTELIQAVKAAVPILSAQPLIRGAVTRLTQSGTRAAPAGRSI